MPSYTHQILIEIASQLVTPIRIGHVRDIFVVCAREKGTNTITTCLSEKVLVVCDRQNRYAPPGAFLLLL